MYVAYEAVHTPLQGPQDAIQRGPNKVQGKRRAPTLVFKDMLQEMDKGVGDVLATVKTLGLAENTLIIFTSDNGPMALSSAGRLRGRKGSIFEGGHRVPTLAWWPGTIKANTVTKETAIGIDILPTLLDLAEIAPPKIRPFDGVSLKPVLLGKPLAPRKLYWRTSGLSPVAKTLEGPDTPKALSLFAVI